MQIKLILLFSIFLNLNVYASTNPFELKEFYECSFCSIKIGIKAQSQTDSRGVILDRNAQVMPGIAGYFFNNQLEVLPTAISYFHYIDEPNLRFRYRLYQVTDKSVIRLQNKNTDDYVHRPNSTEAQIRLESFLGGNDENYIAEFDLSYAKDISAHWGDYLELLFKFKLETYKLEKYKLTLEPNFYASVGWGTSSHNQYFYGPSASQDNINNYAYGIWLAIPNRADRYYPIVLLKKFGVIGSQNSQSEYAKNHNDGVSLSFIYSTIIF